ncbi:hypothetical protein AAHC03_017159 [Spirometra sp. Aus1]
MFRQIVLLAIVCSAFGQGSNSTLEFKENSDYVYTKQLHGHVEQVIVDGVKISNPSNGLHCVAPNDCWEIVKPEKLLVAYGFLKGSIATFTVQPANIPDRYPAAVQYKKVGFPEYDALNYTAKSIVAKEILENETLVHILVSSSDIGHVNTTGNIATTRRDPTAISIFGKTGVLKFDVVLFTGHLGTEPRTMEIKSSNGRVDRITITPSNKPGATAPILTFIDFENSFKKYKREHRVTDVMFTMP